MVQLPDVQVVPDAVVASILAAQPALRDKGDRALLDGLKVTRLLVVGLRRDHGEVVLSGTLLAAEGTVAHAEIRAQNLDAALPRFVDALFGKIDAAGNPRSAAIVNVPASLAEARRLSEHGQSKDAYNMALSLHEKNPLDSATLVELASTECALELMDVCQQHVDEVLESRPVDGNDLARAHLLRAEQRIALRQYDDAATAIDNAENALGNSADNQWQARVLLARQQLAVAREQWPEALDLARRSLTLYRLAEDPRGRAVANLALGDLAADSGNFDECLASYREAANAFETAGDLDGLARASSQSALALGHLGRFNDARAAARRSYEAAMRQQNPLATRVSLYSLAWSLLQSGQLNDARETAHRGLALIEPLGNPEQAMRLTSLLGFIDAAGGRFRTAMTAWDAALSMAHGDPFTVNGLRLAIAYAALNAGDEDRAEAETRRLHADAGDIGAESAGVFAKHADALLAAHRGDLAAAATLYADVWLRARKSGTLNQQLLADYSDVLFKRGDLDTVESLLGEASLPDKEGHLVQLVRARYLLRRGQTEAAQTAFDLAIKLAAERYSPLIDVTRDELAAPKRLKSPR
jgi:tetratricopeptide (TPR) repeat protein